ncbi:hypothetical protein DL93DRAFT_2051709 [Clavulina sp. PMI_390]|nr:hypothetical protein DL93DRAFT_2051709 [Clavulina sp. PMI_390]
MCYSSSFSRAHLCSFYSVNNPNYLSVTFKEISAAATYPSTSVSVGGGAIDNIKFPSSTTAYISFPFTITYTVSSDPNLAVLKDLATKCTASQDLTVNYLLTVSLKHTSTLLSPHFTSSASFQCPLSEADIQVS